MGAVNVLGEVYGVLKKRYDEDEAFERNGISGYCDGYIKLIVYCDMDSYKVWEYEPESTKRACEKHTLRHEIVHAFFNESGLRDSAHGSDGSFAKDEELVDWIANQGPKIYKAWEEAGCLP